VEPPDETQGRLRFAELTSSLGAGVLGVGLGAMAANALRAVELPILVLGAALHLWGMVDKHRIEARRAEARVWWKNATYTLCWGALIALGGYILFVRSQP
jgi:hypothetical protein